MKIFILEDAQERIKFFKDKLMKHDLYIYEHVEEAENFIQANDDMEMLFLDHDLEGYHHIPSELPISGYEFVKFIVEKGLCKNATIIIHSMDVPGSANMYHLLNNNGYKVTRIPFAYLKFQE
jgi:hypothetical protein